jgi:hypothetical protein
MQRTDNSEPEGAGDWAFRKVKMVPLAGPSTDKSDHGTEADALRAGSAAVGEKFLARQPDALSETRQVGNGATVGE